EPADQPAHGVLCPGLCRRGAGADRGPNRPAAQLLSQANLRVDTRPGHRLSNDPQPSLDHQAGLRDRFGFLSALRLSPQGLSRHRQCGSHRCVLLGYPNYRTQPAGLCLLLTAYAMAISSTLCGAILVENGQRLGASDAFVNQQWLWFNIAALASGFIGGQLGGRVSPGRCSPCARTSLRLPPPPVGVPPLVSCTETHKPPSPPGK